MVADDPVVTNPDHYSILFENEFVRVLEYLDAPGDASRPHEHPNSVMITLTAFHRLLQSGDAEREVALPAGVATWLPAQRHSGTNTGETPTHTIFVELKGASAGTPGVSVLGPN
ncbi:cytoplasmic protein [Orlajensenia leifsoniae]|uniref:Cytoplasmic protein n=1 Tax=Orlajensenia leifsoniae TaxID=2561933 RepID=A0A4Y9QZG4_9MICO|nr:cytoplasmic protein [Leifsonia flava]TFV97974.1 cytoplasmic protein [Leifsonia flava]